MKTYERRDILKLFGVGGVTFASGLGCTGGATVPSRTAPVPTSTSEGSDFAQTSAPAEDFFFLQLSDTHWGFKGAPNPEAEATLPQVIQTINESSIQPDFVIFTGDLTQTTDDSALRRTRMREFKALVSQLKVKDVRFIPGEHDASLDEGAAFREFFGDTHYAFSHRGVRFIALDNVSDPGAKLGSAQLEWLDSELRKAPVDAPLVVFAHRPLFDLHPAWDWATSDGKLALEILERHPLVSVFYGHIHQTHEQRIGRTRHYASRSLVFPLPAPGSVAKKAPLAWDPNSADHGLGYREVADHQGALRLVEHPFARV